MLSVSTAFVHCEFTVDQLLKRTQTMSIRFAELESQGLISNLEDTLVGAVKDDNITDTTEGFTSHRILSAADATYHWIAPGRGMSSTESP